MEQSGCTAVAVAAAVAAAAIAAQLQLQLQSHVLHTEGDGEYWRPKEARGDGIGD